ncbi:MAG: hypothetical protein ACHRHE_20660 [Tepidisphaerales bacterium]
MKHLTLATSALVLLVSLLFWIRGPDRSGDSVDRRHVSAIGVPTEVLHPATRPSMPGLYKRIPEVDLRDVLLEDAIERLRIATGLNIVVQWGAIEKLGLDQKTPITLKLRDASALAVARAMLQPRIITLGRPICLVDENILILTAGMDSSTSAETHVYDVSDIILNAITFHSRLPATLPWAETSSSFVGLMIASCGDEKSVVTALDEAILHISRESWVENGGKTGVLTYFAGHFVITTTPETHEGIARLLGELRKGRSK